MNWGDLSMKDRASYIKLMRATPTLETDEEYKERISS